jgi:D-serine/D-alanine/glycine transporter
LLTFEADTRQALVATPIWFIILAVSYYIRSLKRR